MTLGQETSRALYILPIPDTTCGAKRCVDIEDRSTPMIHTIKLKQIIVQNKTHYSVCWMLHSTSTE